MREREWGWKTADGIQVFAREWTPEEPKDTQAVVLIVHGMGEHSGRYRHVGQSFTEQGYAALAFDQIGHGRTEGKRGHTRSYERLLDGIERLLEAADRTYPGKPKFIFGHSMGGNLTLNYLLRNKPGVAGAIVTGPWLKLAFEPPRFQVIAAKLMERIYPQYTNNRPLNPEHLTSDPEMQQLHRQDRLIHGYVSAKFFLVIQRAGLWAIEHAAALNIPLLLMHGGADQVTSAVASRQFAKRAGACCTYKEWPDFCHELHNERQRNAVLNEMLAWLRARTTPID